MSIVPLSTRSSKIYTIDCSIRKDEAIELVISGSTFHLGKKRPHFKILAPHLPKSFDAEEFLTCHSPRLFTSNLPFTMAVKKSSFKSLADQLADLEDPTPKGSLRSYGNETADFC